MAEKDFLNEAIENQRKQDEFAWSQGAFEKVDPDKPLSGGALKKFLNELDEERATKRDGVSPNMGQGRSWTGNEDYQAQPPEVQELLKKEDQARLEELLEYREAITKDKIDAEMRPHGGNRWRTPEGMLHEREKGIQPGMMSPLRRTDLGLDPYRPMFPQTTVGWEDQLPANATPTGGKKKKEIFDLSTPVPDIVPTPYQMKDGPNNNSSLQIRPRGGGNNKLDGWAGADFVHPFGKGQITIGGDAGMSRPHNPSFRIGFDTEF